MLTGTKIVISLHSPRPKINRTLPKRRAESSTHLTGSPFKRTLLEKASKNVKRTGNKKKREATKNPSQCQDSSEEDDWPCLICGESYNNSRSREQWIQCSGCKKWAHFMCTEQTARFMCPNCDSDDDMP